MLRLDRPALLHAPRDSQEVWRLQLGRGPAPDPREHVLGEPRFDLHAVRLHPVSLPQPLPGDHLECVGAQFGARRGDGLAMLPGIDALGQELPSLVAALPGEGKRNVRVHTDRQKLLLPAEAVLQPPVAPSCGLHEQVQPAPVRQLLGLVGGLGAADGGV